MQRGDSEKMNIKRIGREGLKLRVCLQGVTARSVRLHVCMCVSLYLNAIVGAI